MLNYQRVDPMGLDKTSDFSEVVACMPRHLESKVKPVPVERELQVAGAGTWR